MIPALGFPRKRACLGDAEVTENNPAAAEDEDVLRLDVAVEHAVHVHEV